MIVVKLMGGLGNQMFQYAAGRSLAEKLGTQIYMDRSWFKGIASVDTPRHYELNCYAFNARFRDLDSIALADNNHGPKSRLYKLTKGFYKPRLIHVREQGHLFNKDFLKLGDNTYLDGYWQSEKYFKSIRKTLLDDFVYQSPPSDKNSKLLSEIANTDSISLHVRRGDYANNKSAKAFHGLTGLEYYEKAMKRMNEKVMQPKFYIFSDEQEWCKQNLKISQPVRYVEHNKSGAEDMRLMRACKHNIIANSSFSWWAAWLNENPDKIVIAPKKWFNDPTVDTSDVIPKEWIKV